MRVINIFKYSIKKLFLTNLILLIINTLLFASLFLLLLFFPYLGAEKVTLDKVTAINIVEWTLDLEVTDCELIKGENVIYGKWGTEYGVEHIHLSFPNKDVFNQIKTNSQWKDLSKDKTLRQQLEKTDKEIKKSLDNGHKCYGFLRENEEIILQIRHVYAVYDTETDRLYLEIPYS